MKSNHDYNKHLTNKTNSPIKVNNIEINRETR